VNENKTKLKGAENKALMGGRVSTEVYFYPEDLRYA